MAPEHWFLAGRQRHPLVVRAAALLGNLLLGNLGAISIRRRGRVIRRRLLLKVVLVVIVLCIVLAIFDLQMLDDLWRWNLLFAILCIQPFVWTATYFAALRFALLARTPPLPAWPVFKAVLLTNGLNTILPSRLGEFAKPVYLRNRCGIPMSEGMGSVFIERATDVLLLAAFALLGASLMVVRANTALFLVAVALIIAFLLFWKASWMIPLVVRIVPGQRVRAFVERAMTHVSRRLNDRAFYLSLVAALLLWITCWAYTSLFVAVAADRPIDLTTGLLVLVATTLGGAIPVFPAGLGTYEAAVVAVLKTRGYAFEEALMLALALHAAQAVANLAGTAAILVTEKIGVGSLINDVREFARGKPDNGAD